MHKAESCFILAAAGAIRARSDPNTKSSSLSSHGHHHRLKPNDPTPLHKTNQTALPPEVCSHKKLLTVAGAAGVRSGAVVCAGVAF